MMRTAFILCLLALLTSAAPSAARPPRARWGFWLSRPEAHGSRKMAGDFTHRNTTYHHRQSQRGMFSFLHQRPHRSNLAHHPRPASHPTATRHNMTLQ